MNSIFLKNTYLIKERLGMFKASNNYDVLNPENGSLMLKCTEPELGIFTKLFRFTDYKKLTPFYFSIQDEQGKTLLKIKRGVTFFRSDIEVFDTDNKLIGIFKQKFFSFGGKFEIHDSQGKHLCTLQGKWTGWEFKFIQNNKEIALVSKKWAGIGKEFFSSADNYVLNINKDVPENNIRILLLAATFCIDMVFKE